MICSSCNRPHAIMWPYTIRVSGQGGTTVVERQFCNSCEAEYLRARALHRSEPVEKAVSAPEPKRRKPASLPFAMQLEVDE